MEEYGRYLNVVDVEATCWRGAPPDGEVSEFIEIGLCVIDTVRRERVERRRILVRPVRSRVSDFCTELTGLSQADVESGLSFQGACLALIRDHQAGSRPWASWGDYDRKQFQRQCADTGTEYPFSDRHTNAKATFASAYGLRKRPGMARAMAVAGLDMEGRHHSGVDDAWNIGALVLHMMGDGRWPDLTDWKADGNG